MKTHFLFPNRFKKIGWFLFIPGFLMGLYFLFFETEFDMFVKNNDFQFMENFIDEILTLMIIIGGILVGFSKIKNEDEFISKIRYESLVWATYFNFGVVLLATLIFYGMDYLTVMILNIFSLLLFFMFRFHFMLYKLQKLNQDEE